MKPSVRILACTQLEPDFAEELGSTNPLKLIEYAGRWDYGSKSIAKMDPSNVDIIRRWLKQGEESMIEKVVVTFFIECSRVVSHELVRHRLASYQQESQRFVTYEDEDVGSLFYNPLEDTEYDEIATDVQFGLANAFWLYTILRGQKVPKQLARYVLPNAMRTRIIATMNLREWRHVLKLRMHTSAQPEMQDVMRQIHSVLVQRFPEVFDDITGEERASR